MFIHRENAIKGHQHISYCSIHVTLKKTILTQNLLKIFKKRIKLHIFKKISRRVACPLACVQRIPLFLYDKKLFFIQESECNQNIH